MHIFLLQYSSVFSDRNLVKPHFHHGILNDVSEDWFHTRSPSEVPVIVCGLGGVWLRSVLRLLELQAQVPVSFFGDVLPPANYHLLPVNEALTLEVRTLLVLLFLGP